jgi:serine/threonine protein kinase/ABC-type branched-subunit amino acid transport system substrate-binding protein
MSAEEDRSLSQSDAGKEPPDPLSLDTTSFTEGGGTEPRRPSDPAGPSQSRIGQTLGKYRIIGALGRGGMGDVYRAHDPIIERDVAIKLLPEELAGDERALERFLAEAKAAGKLNHPNVVAIYEIGQEGRAYFLVMELIPGGSVADGVDRRHARHVLEATRIAIDACKGLAAAHGVGLIHRDVKPANLLKAADGSIKITDFGLAKAASGRARELTQAGVIVGTPYFMSPEQCDGRTVDARSDIYSLGGTYFSLLTGTNPYQESGSIVQVMYGHCQGKIPDPRTVDSSIPVACASIIARAMAKSPEDRYQTVGEMLGDLQAVAATLSGSLEIDLPSKSGARRVEKLAVATDTSVARPSVAKRGSRLWIGGGIAGVALLIAASFLFSSWRGEAGNSDGAAAINSGLAAAGGAAGRSLSSGATAQGVTATEIVLGMSAPLNGPVRELGRAMQAGLSTHFDAVNQRGGIAGRKIRLVVLDDGYEPNRARDNLETLFKEHKVFAVIGCVGTPTAEKALPYALENDLVFFGAFTGAKFLRRDPPDRYVFNYRASYEEETAAILKYLVQVKRLRPDQVAVFTQEDSYGDAGFSGVSKMVRKLGGDPDQLLRVGYLRNTLDVAEAAEKTINAPDVRAVIMVPTYRPAARFIQLVKDAGKDVIFANVSFVGSNSLADELMQLGPKYCDGVIVTQVVPHPESQASAVSKYRNLLHTFAVNEKPGFVSLEGYIDAMIFTRGLELAGANLTSDTLIDALESIRNLDLGIGTPITFGPSEHQGSHKVWGTVLDDQGHFQILDLE